MKVFRLFRNICITRPCRFGRNQSSKYGATTSSPQDKFLEGMQNYSALFELCGKPRQQMCPSSCLAVIWNLTPCLTCHLPDGATNHKVDSESEGKVLNLRRLQDKKILFDHLIGYQCRHKANSSTFVKHYSFLMSEKSSCFAAAWDLAPCPHS